MSRLELGHLCALSQDPDARGGAVVRCLAGSCPFRQEGSEEQVIAAALDHHEETFRASR